MFRFLLVALVSNISFASEFPLGDASKSWGVKVENVDSQFKLKLGTRLQALGKLKETESSTGETVNETDFYVRRMRLMLQVEYPENWKFYADIRNDDVNKDDKGEQDFNIGDAYFQFKALSGNFKLLRAKVDVSRTETVSSARILFLNRASIADHAAQYVSHNRRATNAQYLGKIGDRFAYQLIVGDGVYSGKFYDAQGNTPGSVDKQNAMIGGRARFSLTKNHKLGKLTETYYGKGKVFDLSAGVYNTSNIQITESANTFETSRTLYNADLTFSQGPVSLFVEYFRFDGEFEDLTTSGRVGSSSGGVIQGEYVFDNYYAPYFRYETWDHFDQEDGYDQTAYVLGLNRYLKGEKFRYGLFYTFDEYDSNIGDEDVQTVQLTMMMNY